jgi:hypothetical protein
MAELALDILDIDVNPMAEGDRLLDTDAGRRLTVKGEQKAGHKHCTENGNQKQPPVSA